MSEEEVGTSSKLWVEASCSGFLTENGMIFRVDEEDDRCSANQTYSPQETSQRHLQCNGFDKSNRMRKMPLKWPIHFDWQNAIKINSLLPAAKPIIKEVHSKSVKYNRVDYIPISAGNYEAFSHNRQDIGKNANAHLWIPWILQWNAIKAPQLWPSSSMSSLDRETPNEDPTGFNHYPASLSVRRHCSKERLRPILRILALKFEDCF